jgi:hypothetical protein
MCLRTKIYCGEIFITSEVPGQHMPRDIHYFNKKKIPLGEYIINVFVHQMMKEEPTMTEHI